MVRERRWVVEGEYFYLPHHKYEGIFELYWLDSNNIDHCVQNFCIEENALALAREDKFWRMNGYTITNWTSATRDLKWLNKQQEGILVWPKIEEEGDGPVEKETEDDKKKRQREARRQRRLARKKASA